jgi:hypothetical protein
VRLYLDPDAHMPPARSIAGSTDQMVETVAAYAAICVDHIVLEPVARGGIAARGAAMEHLMRDVTGSRVRSAARKAESPLSDDLAHDLARSSVDRADDPVAEGGIDRTRQGRVVRPSTQNGLGPEDVLHHDELALPGLSAEKLGH